MKSSVIDNFFGERCSSLVRNFCHRTLVLFTGSLLSYAVHTLPPLFLLVSFSESVDLPSFHPSGRTFWSWCVLWVLIRCCFDPAFSYFIRVLSLILWLIPVSDMVFRPEFSHLVVKSFDLFLDHGLQDCAIQSPDFVFLPFHPFVKFGLFCNPSIQNLQFE